MSRFSRLVVLATAVASLFGAMSATAGAVTWTNDGATAFTATGGLGTLTTTGVTFSCAGSDVAGTAPASSSAATYLITATQTFTSCTFAGSPATVDCGLTFTVTTLVPPIATGNLDMTCGYYISGTKICHLEGSAHAQYTNETGTLAVTTSTSLRMTGASCPFGSNDVAHQTALDFRVTSANAPTLTRVA